MSQSDRDFTLVGRPGDTVFLLIPENETAQEWIDENVQEAPMLGRGIAVEHRFLDDLIVGIENSGLTVHP